MFVGESILILLASGTVSHEVGRFGGVSDLLCSS